MSSTSNHTFPSQMDVDRKRFDTRRNLDLHFQNAKYLQEDFQQRYRTFATFTTIHGFFEIQNTKSIIFKLFWALIICVALGFTFYQVYQSTSQYVNQSTTTTIEQLKKQDVRYPPMYLCVNHWIQWVDWDKAFVHNYSKEAILYGFSCDADVISLEHFNVQQAMEQFESAQRKNNVSTYRDFYLLIGKSIEEFISEIFNNEDNDMGKITVTDLFTDVEVNGYQMCYIAPSGVIKREMEKPRPYDLSKSNMFRMTLNTSKNLHDTLSYLDPIEYVVYILNWLSTDLEHYDLLDKASISKDLHSYLEINMPLWLYANGYSSSSFIGILPQIDKYKITVKALVNRWLDKLDKPCVKDATYIFPDSTCFDECKAKIRANIFGKEDMKQKSILDRTCCQGSIQFLNNHTTLGSIQAKDNRTDNATMIRKELGLSCSVGTEDERVEHFVNESIRCEQVCDPLIGCETWRFEVHGATSSMFSILEKVAKKTSTTLIISYPSDGETLVVVETDKQSWDNFVGTIGGLLGAWTGASILSFIQIFYLCFCTPAAP